MKQVAPELRAYVHGLIVGTLRVAGMPGLNVMQIQAQLALQAVKGWTVPELIAELPTVQGIAQEHNPFIGTMARWHVAQTDS